MNTTETLKELETKLDNVKELLDLEGRRLMEIHTYILRVELHKFLDSFTG